MFGMSRGVMEIMKMQHPGMGWMYKENGWEKDEKRRIYKSGIDAVIWEDEPFCCIQWKIKFWVRERERERGTSCIIYGTSLLYQGRKHVYTYASDQIIVSQCKDSMPRQMQVERLPMKVFLGTAVRLKWTIIIKFSKAASFFYQ